MSYKCPMCGVVKWDQRSVDSNWLCLNCNKYSSVYSLVENADTDNRQALIDKLKSLDNRRDT